MSRGYKFFKHYVPPWRGWFWDSDNQPRNLYDSLRSVGFDSDRRNFDAYNRMRVSHPYTVMDLKQNTSNLPLFYDDQEISGSGTSSTYNTYKASTTIAVSDSTAGRRARQTKTWAQYQPGKGQQILVSLNFRGAVAGVAKRAGMFNEMFGIFFEVTGNGPRTVIRTYNTGSAVDDEVEQEDWNLDKLDGTGDSGYTLDLDKIQILVIDYEWLGAGRVRLGFIIDGKTFFCHQYLHANLTEEVYMSNPNAPIRYEIENDGTGAATSMDTMCISVISEGGQEQHQVTSHVSRNGTPITLAAQDLFTPVLSIRLKADRPCTRVNIDNLSILATTATNFEWSLFLNPTIAGSDNVDWQDVDNSAIQYDISRDNTNTLSGGFQLDGGYGSSGAISKVPVGERVSSFLTIGTNIDGSQDEFVVGVKNIDASGGTVYAGATVGEYC